MVILRAYCVVTKYEDCGEKSRGGNDNQVFVNLSKSIERLKDDVIVIKIIAEFYAKNS